MLTDADLLDTVRRLRGYVNTVDNGHSVAEKALELDDPQVKDAIAKALPEMHSVSKKVSYLLKMIEQTKQYKDMVRKFTTKTNGEYDGE